jgi:hypothetical protein
MWVLLFGIKARSYLNGARLHPLILYGTLAVQSLSTAGRVGA